MQQEVHVLWILEPATWFALPLLFFVVHEMFNQHLWYYSANILTELKHVALHVI